MLNLRIGQGLGSTQNKVLVYGLGTIKGIATLTLRAVGEFFRCKMVTTFKRIKL